MKFVAAIAVTAFFFFAFGRAADQEARYQERVITTKHGQTVDCLVKRYEDGSVYLDDCDYVSVP